MNKLRFIWFVSLVAMCGSLYLSEVMLFTPCTLCWYQRILMYPLPLLFGMAMFRNDLNIVRYTLPMSVIGFGIALFHYLKQKTPWFDHANVCSVGIPCNGQYINWFGFITIPFLSLVAFLLISVASFLILKQLKQTKPNETATEEA